jgi:hypothetical protein
LARLSSLASSSSLVALPKSEPNRFDKLCLALGRVTLAWAQIDTALDYCSLLLRDKYGGHAKWRELPRTRLNQKIKFLRDCMNDNPSLATAKAEGLAIAADIETASEERHWLVHGATFVLGEGGLLRQTRNKMTAPEISQERETSVEDIHRFHEASLTLAERLTMFLLRTLLRISQDEINEARRKAGIGTA